MRSLLIFDLLHELSLRVRVLRSRGSSSIIRRLRRAHYSLCQLLLKGRRQLLQHRLVVRLHRRALLLVLGSQLMATREFANTKHFAHGRVLPAAHQP